MSNPLAVCIWFDGQAEAAANLYCSIFKDSKITTNTPMVVTFELNGMKFMGLNGGPQFKPDEAFSIMVNCDTQEEIDYYWNSLTANGGNESRCGWLKDKFGISWQIIPSSLGKIMSNPARAGRAMQAIMTMNKLDIAAIEHA